MTKRSPQRRTRKQVHPKKEKQEVLAAAEQLDENEGGEALFKAAEALHHFINVVLLGKDVQFDIHLKFCYRLCCATATSLKVFYKFHIQYRFLGPSIKNALILPI